MQSSSNLRLIIISALVIVLSPTFCFSQGDHTPEILGIVPNITNGHGTIVVAYRDRDKADTLTSIRLRIGNSSNSHVFFIHVNVEDRFTMIRTDEQEWVVSEPHHATVENDHLSVNTNRMAHNVNGEYGWIIIPVTFDLEKILPEGGNEIFNIAAKARDQEDNITDSEVGVAFAMAHDGLLSIGEGPDDPQFCSYSLGSVYRWLGFGAKQVELYFVIATCHDEFTRPGYIWTIRTEDNGKKIDLLRWDYHNKSIVEWKQDSEHFDFYIYNIWEKQFLDHNQLLVHMTIKKTKSDGNIFWIGNGGVQVYVQKLNREGKVEHEDKLMGIGFLPFYVPSFWLPTL